MPRSQDRSIDKRVVAALAAASTELPDQGVRRGDRPYNFVFSTESALSC
jgi:hypothetical protein